MKKNRMLYLLFVMVFSTVTMASVLYARPYGRVGRSGKQGATCSSCHLGSQAPELNFTVADTATAGSTIDLAFTVRRATADTTSDEAGFNVAIEAGELLGKNETPAECTGLTEPTNSNITCISLEDGLTEISHARPAALDNGAYTFEFRWTVPITPGTYTLYGSGLSALTGTGGFTTDAHAGNTTTTITVVEQGAIPEIDIFLPFIRRE